MGDASYQSCSSHREGGIHKRSRQITRPLKGHVCEEHTCSHNAGLHIPPDSSTTARGTSRRDGHEDSLCAHLRLQHKVICQVKSNDVSKVYLRKSQRKIQDQGFILSFQVQATVSIWKDQKLLSAGNSTETGKSQAKLEPKKTEIAEILAITKSGPATLTEENRPERESFTAGWQSNGLRTHIC